MGFFDDTRVRLDTRSEDAVAGDRPLGREHQT